MPRPPRTFRCDAIILRRRNFGEADRLLSALTAEHGRLELVAKGARRASSSKTGHVELFTRSTLLVARGRELGIVRQAELRAAREPLREDLERAAWAWHVAELGERFTSVGADESSALFKLLDVTFQRLCDETDPRLATRHFELRLLDATGFRPELQRCVLGGEPVRPEDQFFSYADGGVLCPAEGAGRAGAQPVTMGTLKLLRHLQRSSWEEVRALRLREARQRELERLLTGYLTWVLEQRLRGMEFARRVRAIGAGNL